MPDVKISGQNGHRNYNAAQSSIRRLIIGVTSSYLALVEVATSSASILGPQSEDAIKNAHFYQEEEEALAQKARRERRSSD